MLDDIQKFFKSSTAEAFLTFSGIFVIIAIYANHYIELAFFTLFYAIIAHRIRVISKLETSEHAMKRKCAMILYFFIDFSLLITWMTGSILILPNNEILLKLLRNINILSINVDIFSIFGYLSCFAILSIIILIIYLFSQKNKSELEKKPKSITEDFEIEIGSLKIRNKHWE